MLIDPSGRNIKMNVEEWTSDIINNEFSNNTDLSGFVHSIYQGTFRKFKCSGTIYGENIDLNVKYLESLALDDIVEVSLDVNLFTCKSPEGYTTVSPVIAIVSELPESANDGSRYVIGSTVYAYIEWAGNWETLPLADKTIFYVSDYGDYYVFENGIVSRYESSASGKDTINGYISIESIKISEYGINAREYSMDGYFFNISDFELKTIDSYFGMDSVVVTSESTAQNSLMSLSLGSGVWNEGGIVVSTISGISYTLKPSMLLDCTPSYLLIDSGNNACKWQIISYAPDGGIYDISFVVLNRGGFKLKTNLQWDIVASNYNKAIYSNSNGYNSIADGEIGSSVLFANVGASTLANVGNMVVNGSVITTSNEIGNVITIVSSNQEIINSISTGSEIPVQASCIISYPTGGEQFTSSDGHCYIPIGFKIYDDSNISSIKIELYNTYNAANWTMTGLVGTVLLDSTYKQGGYTTCDFGNIATTYNAAIKITVYHSNGNSESCWTNNTFGINVKGANNPLATSAGRYDTYNYTIFQTNDFVNGIYDLYIGMSVTSGKCCADVALGTGNTSVGGGSTYLQAWSAVLDLIFTIPKGTVTAGPSFSSFTSIDYGGSETIMIDKMPHDPNTPSTAWFKRTVLIDQTIGSLISIMIKNLGSGKISGFTIFAVPLFSRTNGYYFIGDCANATTPDVKNSILIPK